MIIFTGHLEGVPVGESKCDPILAIHADAGDPAPVSLQPFQSMSGRHRQVVDDGRGVDALKTSHCHRPEGARNRAGSFGVPTIPDVFRALGAPATNHRTEYTTLPVTCEYLHKGPYGILNAVTGRCRPAGRVTPWRVVSYPARSAHQHAPFDRPWRRTQGGACVLDSS